MVLTPLTCPSVAGVTVTGAVRDVYAFAVENPVLTARRAMLEDVRTSEVRPVPSPKTETETVLVKMTHLYL